MSLFTFLGILGALLVLDVQLALVVFATLPLLVVGTYFFRRQSVKAYELARERVSVVNADLQESVAGLRMVQAFRGEERGAEQFARRSDGYRRAGGARPVADLGLLPLRAAPGRHGDRRGTLVVGAGRIEDDTLTAGALVAYLLYIELFFAPVQQLSQVFDGYQQAAVSLRRIQELLREESSTPAAASPREVAALRGGIEFRDVHFHYATEDPAGAPGGAGGALGHPADHSGRADGRLRRRDRCGQVHPGQAGRTVLRPDPAAPSWRTVRICAAST